MKLNKYLKTLKIIHPYGSLGELSGRDIERNGFGGDQTPHAVVEMSEGIKTFTEGAGSQEREMIRDALHEAELVIFLGFSFLPLNMEMLIGGEKFSAKRVIATGKGLSENSRAVVEAELTEIFIPGGDIESVTVEYCTCYQLFHE